MTQAVQPWHALGPSWDGSEAPKKLEEGDNRNVGYWLSHGAILHTPRLPTSGILVTWMRNDPLCFSVITETVMEPGFEPKPSSWLWPLIYAESLFFFYPGNTLHTKGCFHYSSHLQWPLKTGKNLALGFSSSGDWTCMSCFCIRTISASSRQQNR